MRESHKIIALLRVARTGVLNFVRNAWLSTAATAIMVVTLTILLSTLVLNKALDDTIKEIAKDITVSIYLVDNVDQGSMGELENAIKNNEEVKSVTFISKEEAQRRYLTRYEHDAELTEAIMIVGNAFPASFEVELKSLSDNDKLVSTVRSQKYTPTIDKFDESRLERVGKVGDAQRFITRAGIAAGTLFAIISTLVIFNTIRMAIFTRSDEITIMRLIGATNWFIRGPFLFEAMIYGLLAALVSLIIVYTSLNTLGPKVNRHVYFTPTIELLSAYWPLVVLGTLSVGVLIGVLSSSLATSRYMKK